jgi:hypothetical protein
VVEARQNDLQAPVPSRSAIDGAAGTPIPLPSLPWWRRRMSKSFLPGR